MSLKRVFVALPFSLPGRKKALAWQESHSSWPVRWLATENLHLTIVPPFSCVAANIPKLALKIKKISVQADLKGEKITFSQIASGPNIAQPRLFWWQGKVSPKVVYWQRRLGQNIYSNNFSRPFSPHVTLARFPLTQSGIFAYLRENYFWQEEIKKVALWESIFLPNRAIYKELYSFSF